MSIWAVEMLELQVESLVEMIRMYGFEDVLQDLAAQGELDDDHLAVLRTLGLVPA